MTTTTGLVQSASLGYPRLGAERELKWALEAFWLGKQSAEDLHEVARMLRRTHWEIQRDAGIEIIPSNDFSLYDHVLDTIVMVGAVPQRYDWQGDRVNLDTYFAMARGGGHKQGYANGNHVAGVPAMEMTKWFDTNYHYIVPEFAPEMTFRLGSTKAVDEFIEARALGIHTRPVLLGPISFLFLGKSQPGAPDRFALLPQLLPVYAEVLQQLEAAGATEVQIDEPVLALDLEPAVRSLYLRAYNALAQASGLKVTVAAYFGALRDNLPTALSLPVATLHLDLVRGGEDLEPALRHMPATLGLSLGVISGENVWSADLDVALETVRKAVQTLGPERVTIAPSTSLIYVPHDLAREDRLDEEIKGWLAFARQKLDEVRLLQRAINEGEKSVRTALDDARATRVSRLISMTIYNRSVQSRMKTITPEMSQRQSPFVERRRKQQARLQLPLLPTTTIGSFPQTAEVRAARLAHRKGQMDTATYHAFLQGAIERALRVQEEIGLDVLVHGEFERTDMVEYFGEQLSGFAFTTNGWVQSYGSRAVRPPILFGDVARTQPMTVAWSTHAQSCTDLPVKGMLTGPVTILNWSFVRDDQPVSVSCKQIALAIRDEVQDLEAAGIQVIQVDEPALREGLPLRKADWAEYLDWAVECFKLSVAGVGDETQIHTHMCYAEFEDILGAIEAMDADVISIESSRSQMSLLDAFAHESYSNDIGPGVYDIHSPRVPSAEEMERLLEKALKVIPPEQLWVNPDCGLKTRRWEEVVPALQAMVNAARVVREGIRERQGRAKEDMHG